MIELMKFDFFSSFVFSSRDWFWREIVFSTTILTRIEIFIRNVDVPLIIEKKKSFFFETKRKREKSQVIA